LGQVLDDASVSTIIIGPEDSISSDVLTSASGLVVLGGPMAVYEADRHPRLLQEQALIRNALSREVPVLGICLGSQLLAAALGAKVYPGAGKELGWFDVSLERDAGPDALFRGLPPRFKALHWHGDVFDLPPGARWLARSGRTEHQAFSVGKAWGLLFHLEAGLEEVERMTNAFPEELSTANVSRDALLLEGGGYAAEVRAIGLEVFSRWVGLVRA
jgi:GMP synthase (glutamine-hydrolysing)